MKERIIKKENFIKTKWTGGETTQLAIYPEDAIFAERDFLWRISSASFTSTESRFSDFRGYQRYILPLEGKIMLSHKGLYNRELDKYEVDYFDGGWTTLSRNTIDCRDYNFIVKSGSLANMQILNEDDEYIFKESKVLTIFSMNDFILKFKNQDKKRYISGYSLLVLETENEESIKIENAKLPVIVTEFKIR